MSADARLIRGFLTHVVTFFDECGLPLTADQREALTDAFDWTDETERVAAEWDARSA